MVSPSCKLNSVSVLRDSSAGPPAVVTERSMPLTSVWMVARITPSGSTRGVISSFTP